MHEAILYDAWGKQIYTEFKVYKQINKGNAY